MDDQAQTAPIHGDPPAAAEVHALPDRKELALVAVERTRMPMVVSDARQPDNPIVLANQAFLDLTGYAPHEVIGLNCRFLQGPETDPADIEAIRQGLANSSDYVEVELLNYRKDGSSFRNALCISPVRNDAGEVVYYFASQKDVTARRRAEQLEAAERMLLKEVDHRAMNALALVQSFVSLSRADTAAGYADSVRGRISALARAHRLLATGGWVGIDIKDLLYGETPEEARDRLDVVGAPLRLSAELAQPMALIFHELISNATRHGSLSQPGGTVSVHWSGQDGTISLSWHESGGPAVVAPSKLGVGLSMLSGVVERQLHGRVETMWSAPGLKADIVLRSESVQGPS
jgi:PAS domain S-box-containing protein